MDDIIRRAMRSALFFVAACLLLWIFIPDGRTVAAGLILGLLASMINTFMLRRKIGSIDLAPVEGRLRKPGIGLGGRIAMVLLVAMMAMKFPDRFNLPAALFASFYLQFAVLILALLHNVRDSNGKG